MQQNELKKNRQAASWVSKKPFSSLPLNLTIPVIRKQKNILFYLLLWLPYILVYQLTNRFPVFDPVQLELTWLDRTIPFIESFIPLYVSYLIYIFTVIIRCRDDYEVTRIFYLSYFQVLLSAVFFILFPVSYPRELFYNGDGLAGVFGKFWILFDTPNNCLPSLHTANSLLAISFCRNKPYFALFAIWGGLIIISTLLCKQHYVVDVIAGFGVFILTRMVGKRLFERPVSA